MFSYIHFSKTQSFTLILLIITFYLTSITKSISGVIDFGDAQIGDPAFDFAGLYYDFGDEFTTSVYEQYSTLISHHDPLLIHRITTFLSIQSFTT